MNQQETQQNNKLIADFMGLDTSSTTHEGHPIIKGEIIGNLNMCQLKDAEYHTSWDWLMPVIKKLKSYPYHEGVPEERLLKLESRIGVLWDGIVIALANADIDRAYPLVVGHIVELNKAKEK